MNLIRRLLAFLAFLWRWLRAPVWLSLGALAGFLVPYVIQLDGQVRARFDDLSWQIPSRVLARPLDLAVGRPMTLDTLLLELDASRYRKDGSAQSAGTFSQDGGHFIIARRAFNGLDGRHAERRIALDIGDGQITTLVDAGSGQPLAQAELDPARIATLYGMQQEERRVVQLEQLPTLLLTGLQAVEDREFKHHHGINLSSILRASWVNLRAGRVVQGGSTLTQQLVKNLFLDRSRSFVRKFNEALIALIIEYRYDKRRILEAYVNEIFLGQQGGQAVHGFAAAAEFYFGREVAKLDTAEIALLVGMVRGPSEFDPRRAPEHARERRNLVLGQFHDTGLIDAAQLSKARSTPLNVSAKGALPRNRYPAFLDLVRRQLQRDFSEQTLDAAGLVIHTTLAPSAQIQAETALAKSLKDLGKIGSDLQAAAVVTSVPDGEVLALVGGREVDGSGFNRALDARRPIGSLVKPFVYLTALAQPQRYSLASIIEDAPVSLSQPDGSRWIPRNADGEAHGRVMLIDALVNSWNLATVQLGLRVGVERVRGLLDSFALGADINPNPSLLLGAVELSPLNVAQLYQYFAADGHAVPLRAVRGIVDSKGRPVSRFGVKPGSGDYVVASRLLTWAMQQVVESGTARSIGEAGLANLHAAGKTGTSDSQRDSWFAGFSGNQLGVVWMGRDDNSSTRLYGSTGALRAWIDLFKRLPAQALASSRQGLEFVWIDPQSTQRSDPVCTGARELPFIEGYAPQERHGCALDKLRDWFGGNDE